MSFAVTYCSYCFISLFGIFFLMEKMGFPTQRRYGKTYANKGKKKCKGMQSGSLKVTSSPWKNKIF